MTSKWAPEVNYAKLFVGGLRKEHTEEILEKYFSEYGRIRYCKVPKDSENQSRGFAFVCFYDVADAALVLRRPHKIDHWSIHVKPCDANKTKWKDRDVNKTESNEGLQAAENQSNKTGEHTHGAVSDNAGCSQVNRQLHQFHQSNMQRRQIHPNNFALGQFHNAAVQRFPQSTRQRAGLFQQNNSQRGQFQQPHIQQGQYNPYNLQQGQFLYGIQRGPYQAYNLPQGQVTLGHPHYNVPQTPQVFRPRIIYGKHQRP